MDGRSSDRNSAFPRRSLGNMAWKASDQQGSKAKGCLANIVAAR